MDRPIEYSPVPVPGEGRSLAPMTHQLKIQSRYFEDVVSGKKKFEIRKNDRMYQTGDRLVLHEIPRTEKTKSRTFEVVVTHVLHGGMHGLDADYCILSIQTADPIQRIQDVVEDKCLNYMLVTVDDSGKVETQVGDLLPSEDSRQDIVQGFFLVLGQQVPKQINLERDDG